MKTRTHAALLLTLATLLTAACNGGSRSSNPAVDPPVAPATPPTVLDQVRDAQGNTVAAQFASAVAVNAANQAVGFAATAPGAPVSAALWKLDPTGAIASPPARLPPLAGNDFSAAFAIDEAGRVVGQSAKGARRVAVLWAAPGAPPTELPGLHASGNSAAYGVSADGKLVVGEAQDAAGATRAVVWTANGLGRFVTLPAVLPVNRFNVDGFPSTLAAANGIAQVGAQLWVVGEVEDGAGIDHAVLWRSADGVVFTATDLRRKEHGSAAVAVNQQGVIVGEAETSPGTFVPARWSQDDGGTELQRVDLAASGSARAVDASGRVAGSSGPNPDATVWSASGAGVQLFSGGEQSHAYGFGGDGFVVGRRGNAGFVKRVDG